MYLENDPKKKLTLLQPGDRCHFKPNGRVQLTRQGVVLESSSGSSEYLVCPGHPASPAETARLIAETHGREIRWVQGEEGETVFEFA